ncbi:phage/plasmid primase, P4 family [Paraburkholderia sp. ZP32-5]|uniref:phage/plasmid primase, P4 family n=1 Tax=Paraburkholderia sp. ZP32-5 TaxID=2883245 RepID=UPI001F2ED193|nr:phage/plasmid primase, P4 family [Paraburkholderia sp. ZP32-5]
MLTVQTYHSTNKSAGEIHYIKPTADAIAKIAKLCESGHNVSVVPQRTDGLGRKKENIKGIRFLVVDLDRRVTKAEVETIIAKVKPAFIVQSSKCRYHIYFRVKCSLSEYQDLALSLANALGGDVQATDLGRAFRLAGTINWKTDREHFVARLSQAKARPDAVPASRIVKSLGGTIKSTMSKSSTPPRLNNPSARLARAEVERSPDQMTRQEVEELLRTVPATERKVWFDIGAAIHDWDPSKSGFLVWDAWSRAASEKYNEADQQPTWDGFRRGEGRTIKSLRWYAKQFDSGTQKNGETWIPTSSPDIVEYAKDMLSGRLKIHEKAFYVFTNGVWRNDRKETARVLQGIIKDLLATARTSKAEGAVRALNGLKSFVQANKMLEEFLTYPELDAKGEDFDFKPELLGVPDGVVNLRTGQFRQARPEDMVSRSTAARFDESAKCPAFHQFIRDIAGSDDYRRYLQTVLGYLFIGHSNEQKAFFMLGSGSNGKGTLTRAIQTVMGDKYYTTLSPALMKGASKGNGNGPTPAIMTLRGVRAAFCTETERKNGIDEPFFKQLTGNDALTGRHNYEGQEMFKPQCKLLISTNAMPDWQYEDQALWRRVVVLPFTRQFEGGDRNSNLDSELAAESSGILNWMIEGAKRYLKHGLGTCRKVEEATDMAHESADTVQRWIEAKCRTGKDLSVRSSDAFESYQAFVERLRLAALTQKKFRVRMLALDYQQKRISQSMIFRGLALNS